MNQPERQRGWSAPRWSLALTLSVWGMRGRGERGREEGREVRAKGGRGNRIHSHWQDKQSSFICLHLHFLGNYLTIKLRNTYTRTAEPLAFPEETWFTSNHIERKGQRLFFLQRSCDQGVLMQEWSTKKRKRNRITIKESDKKDHLVERGCYLLPFE